MNEAWLARLAEAIGAHRAGSVDEAEHRCRQLLTEQRHPWVLHALGVIELGRGRDEQAAALLDEALRCGDVSPELATTAAVAWSRLGAVDRALELYAAVLEADPDHRDALCGLGALEQARGHLEPAILAFERCVAAHPEFAEGWCNLGGALGADGRFGAAAEAYRRALLERPDFEAAHVGRTWALHSGGSLEALGDAAEQWVAVAPDHPIAQHWSLATSGQSPSSGCSVAFVERYFDAFAASYESTLHGLDYAIARLLATTLDELAVAAETALDGGCGTGLCGPVLRAHARRLIGLDLSPGMLALAEAKQIYDQLVVGELVEHLQASPGAYDLVVLGDVLPYFGALDRLFAAVGRALRPDGWMWCCFETLDGDGEPGFELASTGRYRHRRAAVVDSLRRIGLQVVRCEPAALRHERGRTVDGWTMLVRHQC